MAKWSPHLALSEAASKSNFLADPSLDILTGVTINGHLSENGAICTVMVEVCPASCGAITDGRRQQTRHKVLGSDGRE